MSTADPYRRKAYMLDRETAPAFWLVGTLWMPMATGHQTGNRFSLIEQWMPTGLGPPTHRHPGANEGFYVLDGTVAFNADGGTVHAGPGTFLHLPRLLPHSFSVDTEEAHVLNFYAPSGFELVVMSAARPAEERRRPTLDESAAPSCDQIRILSDLFGQEEVSALPFCQPSEPGMMRTEPGAVSGGVFKAAKAADVPRRMVGGMDWRVLTRPAETEGTYGLAEVAAPAGSHQPLRAPDSDEAMYVLDGAIEVTYDGTARIAKAGSLTYHPAGSGLTWTALQDARLLVFTL